MENQGYIQNHAFETVDHGGTINDCPYIEGTSEYNLWIKTYDEYLNSLDWWHSSEANPFNELSTFE